MFGIEFLHFMESLGVFNIARGPRGWNIYHSRTCSDVKPLIWEHNLMSIRQYPASNPLHQSRSLSAIPKVAKKTLELETWHCIEFCLKCADCTDFSFAAIFLNILLIYFKSGVCLRIGTSKSYTLSSCSSSTCSFYVIWYDVLLCTKLPHGLRQTRAKNDSHRLTMSPWHFSTSSAECCLVSLLVSTVLSFSSSKSSRRSSSILSGWPRMWICRWRPETTSEATFQWSCLVP